MKISEAINKSFNELKNNKIEEPKLKSIMLMENTLQKTKQYIIANDIEELSNEQEQKYFLNVNKLKEKYPIEYITNKKEFMKLDFYVDENVLVPRQDTEILVQEVIEIAKKTNAKKILDMCTGSGAIGISIAKNIKDCKVIVADVSKKAIEIAKKNAINNQVEKKIEFIHTDLFEKISKEKFDIIVSNPPYIKKEDIITLDKQVQKEPIIALDGGEDGLEFYRRIIKDGYMFLNKNGYICLEIGFDQKEEVIKIINKDNKYINTYSKKDLYDNDRIIVTQYR